MEITLANVLRRCIASLSREYDWVRRQYDANYAAAIDVMTEVGVICELGILLQQCSCEDIGRLYEEGCLSRAAVIIAADVVAQRGESSQACVRNLISQFNHFGKCFFLREYLLYFFFKFKKFFQSLI